MYQFTINSNEAGQRFDKYLHKLLPKAPASFFYKMLRKKNIVLNGKKAEGKEKLSIGDEISLFLSEETFLSFQDSLQKESEFIKAYQTLKDIQIVFENQNMLIVNKPSGILTQKSKDSDLSLNEWLIGYLLFSNAITRESLRTFKPSVCNRLDRNTSGLVLCSKTLKGSQRLSMLIRERKVHKFYRLFVKGSVEKEELLKGYLVKDELTNKVIISETPIEQGAYIKTRFYPVQKLSDMTYLEVELITGKTHQIRAHMASVGHPILMDYKYGDHKFNEKYKDRFPAQGQLLHAYRLEFSKEESLLEGAGPVFIAEEPSVFQKLLLENK
ncbi:MAG: RluA family pseudouridine synthase [Lachnospiraceae bacterium]|nr:RluA family pseudouridine synthase [Lachnospiraceae bacterium]MCI7189095.1 RluA family pseudouridine synthase [Lachnospiraceae bacterium]MDD7628254.1 RluA family pseudouridine synthase [Lachnospiraceae bacterium]MDY4118243.1 RluA family pseudouridine synthase [Lachnospiraceae bacterium]